MDEEQEILQSSLEQSNKISIGSFFGSPIGGLANRAILQSNTSLKSSIANRNLIATLQASIELLRGQLQQITTYVLLDRQERGRIVKQKETEAFEREDQIQKGIIRPENAQPRGLEDSLPFFPEARFSEGLTAGMSSIGERQGVAEFQERFVEGSRPFFLGGLVPGFGNADTVNAKLTPGEFVVPKNTVENLSPNFFKGLISSSKNNEKVESNDYFVEGETELVDDGDGMMFYNPKDVRNYLKENNPKMLEKFSDMGGGTQSINTSGEATLQSGKVVSGDINQFDDDTKLQRLNLNEEKVKAIREHGFNSPEVNEVDKKLMILSGIPERAIYTDKEGKLQLKGYSTYDGETTVEGDEKGKGLFGGLFGGNKKNENVRSDEKDRGFFKNLFGSKKNENVRSDEKEGRGLFGAIGGTIDAATGNLTDFDKRGGKPFGLMRGITGTIDAPTGGLTELDRRGGKPFGLMRGITGSIDAMTGGLTDLDRRGGKPFGTMRLATGVADAMTGNLFDFDRRGRGEEEKKKLRDKDGRYIGDNARKKNFQNMMDKNLYNKSSQLPMETTVNPDGSITSEGSGTFIGGELVKPGEPLTPMQRAAITMNIQMGNTYSSEIMEKYNNSGGTPSKEEFDNYEKEKSKNIRPEEEKSKNLKPEQTLGERFMNIFRGKDEELTKGFSTYPSVEPANQSNLKVAPSESIKTAAQGLMSPPPPPPSETIELPPQTQGDVGGGDGIQGGVPQFKPSTPSHDPLTGTESPLIFVEVISNPFLSIP